MDRPISIFNHNDKYMCEAQFFVDDMAALIEIYDFDSLQIFPYNWY